MDGHETSKCGRISSGNMRIHNSTAAVTLTELLAGILIVGILASLIIPSFDGFRSRSEAARCVQNLRSFHVSVSGYMNDKETWPQVPKEILKKNVEFGKWWIKELAPYGFRREMWICPTAARSFLADGVDEDFMSIHYTPTPFDNIRFTPFRWSNMPWAVEVGDYHGKGNLTLMQDGTVLNARDLIFRQGGGAPPGTEE